MSATPEISILFHQVVSGIPSPVLDVLGPTIEFVTGPDAGHGFCVLRGVVPPGVTVPLHSHDDREDFLILAGTQQVLMQGAGGLEWADAHAGDYVHIPAGTLHAHRNLSREPAVDLIITTARLGQFFADVGRPVSDAMLPPGPEDVARFAAVVAKYGYTNGSPEENAAVGIEMAKFALPRGQTHTIGETGT